MAGSLAEAYIDREEPVIPSLALGVSEAIAKSRGVHVMSVRWLALLLVLVVLPQAAECQDKKKPPNIIYIMSDDHANAAIGAYNSWLKPVVKTPNLDKLAKNGVRF